MKEDGIHATNRDFLRYEQVAKAQSYRLAETPSDEQFDDEFRIRTCDMRSPTFARELGDALREIGFAILEGHGVDPALYDEAHDRIAEMFERLSLDDKMRFRAQRHGSVNQGYFPIKETSNMHPDLVEGWVFCRRAFDPATAAAFWPLPEYQPFFQRLVNAHERLMSREDDASGAVRLLGHEDRASRFRWRSMWGRTSCWRSCPAPARRNIRR